MSTETIIVIVVVGGVFLLLNVIFLGILFFTQRRVNVVNQWPTTTGTVTLSTVEARSDSEGGTTYYPVVRYSYQVGGQIFQGSRIAPGMEVGGSGAGKVSARYPMGAQVPVYYDPQSPSDAVLEKKAPAQFWVWFILVIIDCVLCGVVPGIIWASSR